MPFYSGFYTKVSFGNFITTTIFGFYLLVFYFGRTNTKVDEICVMNKVLRIILLVIIVPCTLIGFIGTTDEIISNHGRLRYVDPTVIIPFLFSCLSIPFILFNLKFVRNRKVKLNSIIDNEFIVAKKEIYLPKWIFIGNALFGLYNLILGLYLFFTFMVTELALYALTAEWIRNLVILVMVLIGVLILIDKRNIGSLKKWITDLYRPPWEMRRSH